MRFTLPGLFLLTTLSLTAQTTPSWDNSGNGLLNGTYYMRNVIYIVGDNAGDISRALALYGTISFDGNGNYTLNGTLLDSDSGGLSSGTIPGTYSISASGYGFLSHPLSSGDFIYGLVSRGVFVGSSTESTSFNDLFVAAKLASPAPTLSSFQGQYTLAWFDVSGAGAAYAADALMQLTPDGNGNLGTVNIRGYVGAGGSTPVSQVSSNVKYFASGGAEVLQFPNSSSAAFIVGNEYLYTSEDGNFVFGGSPQDFDLFIGVKGGTSTATPAFSGLYYQAGLDEDESQIAAGFASLDTYYGSLAAGNGSIIGHQRLSAAFAPSAIDYTYSDAYTLSSTAAYDDAFTNMHFVFGAGGAVRIGYGIGPYLGINVALQAPNFSGSGVYLNPAGIVNAASSSPFTSGIAPGEFITLYGSNLAANTQVASTAPFPTTLGNVQVIINGVAAPIYFVSQSQVSVIVPYATTSAFAQIQVFNNGVGSNAVTLFVNQTAPGVFTKPAGGLGYAAALHGADNTPVTPSSPAQIGETIAVYVTGLGVVSPPVPDGSVGPSSTLSTTTSTIAARVGGLTAAVAYAGLAPQLAGLYQVNVTIPAGLANGDALLDIAGPDSYSSEALITIGSATSPSGGALMRRTPPLARRK